MLRVALAGCHGKMGKILVQTLTNTPSVKFTAATVSPNHPLTDTDVGSIAGIEPLGFTPKDNLGAILNDFDVLIDFTRVNSTLGNVEICQKHHKKMVIGTTGFNETQKQQILNASKMIPIVFAPNMSIAMNMCFALSRLAAQTLGDNADVEIIDAHHSHKIDVPSGTSLKMGEVIAQALNRDLEQVAVYDRRGLGPRQKNSIGFSSIRARDIVAEQTVLFALDGERVEITHRAASRIPFAIGAIKAAQWLSEKPAGLYSMQDVIRP